MTYDEKKWKAATQFSVGDDTDPTLYGDVETALLAYIHDRDDELTELEVVAWAPVPVEAKATWAREQALELVDMLCGQFVNEYDKHLTKEETATLHETLTATLVPLVVRLTQNVHVPICERTYSCEEIRELLNLEDEPEDCAFCTGTGIGNPHLDTACSACGGSGVKKQKREHDPD